MSNEVKQKTNVDLLSSLKKLKSAELEVVARSLIYINEVFDRKLDLEMGHPSIYEFAHDELGYEKDMAYSRIRAAEAIRLDIEFEEHLRAGGHHFPHASAGRVTLGELTPQKDQPT